MPNLMRCMYCGLLQDEPTGVKECLRCSGELIHEAIVIPNHLDSYLIAQMELDQVSAPSEQMIDRHLLLTLKTPDEVPSTYAAKTKAGRPPLSFHVVMDVSGSMRGAKLDQTKQALRMTAGMLHEGDLVSLSVFSDEPKLILKPTRFSRKTRKLIESAANELEANGLTALYGGLDLGIQQAKHEHLDSNLILLLSDGQANIGETDLEIVGQLARDAAKTGLIVSTLGVGDDYNEALMTEIATQGRGRFYHVASSNQITTYLTGELGEVADLAVRDAHIRIIIPHGGTLIPFSAAYQSELIQGIADISIGDIPSNLEVEIPLRLTLNSGMDGERLSINGEVQYVTPSGSHLKTVLNQVTVRFVDRKTFKPDMGIVKPVVEQVAYQMRAAQVLQYSRAMSRGSESEKKQVDRNRIKLRDYLSLLGEDIANEMNQEMDSSLNAIKLGGNLSKKVISASYQAQRFMRDLTDKD